MSQRNISKIALLVAICYNVATTMAISMRGNPLPSGEQQLSTVFPPISSGIALYGVEKNYTLNDINEGAPVRQGLLLHSKSEQSVFMPLISSVPFIGVSAATKRSKQITKVMIIAQPYSGLPHPFTDATKSFLAGWSEIFVQNQVENTLLVSPWFIFSGAGYENFTGPDFDATLPEKSVPAYWANAGSYTNGADDLQGNISSIEVYDAVIQAVQDSVASALPNLETISIFGFSGGCKILNRWSFFTNKLLPPSLDSENTVKVQMLGGGCNNFLYFDEYRPSPQCSPVDDQQYNGTCDSFVVPNRGCKKYDHFPYGIGYAGSKYGYVKRFLNDSQKVKKARDSYKYKDITLSVGSWDNCCCDETKCGGYNNPKYCYPGHLGFCNDVFSDVKYALNIATVGGTCSKLHGGLTRYQRFGNYMSYLKNFHKRHDNTTDYEPNAAYYVGQHAWDKFLANRKISTKLFGFTPPPM